MQSNSDVPSTSLQNNNHEKSDVIDGPPEKMRKKLDKANEKVVRLKKKLKVSQQKSRRLKTKVKSLKALTKQLREKNLISSSCEEMLERNFSGVPFQLIKRMNLRSGKGSKYSPELKSFALTLQFYSSKAYEFVRKTFNLALPHQVQVRKWYAKIPADPGFTEPAFQALKFKVEEAHSKGQKVICSLMLDEMAIKKHVSWDGKKFRGYVDVGNGIDENDSSPVAKDALVLMAVAVNGSWKVPCGYFLVDGLSGKERANLVKVCIKKLSDVGVDVVSLTCDGPSCHFTMLKQLGACLNIENLRCYFVHPLDKNKKIYVLLDICHMLKLVRNTLGAYNILFDKDGNKICREYIVELQKLQDKEGLRLGNKLKFAHIKWQQQKMKVDLAAQSLSSSVADAIEYCTNVLKLPQFQGSDATVKFIRIIDHLFDILNSRNPCAKGYKAALRVDNKRLWQPFLDEASSYIKGLKNEVGNLMYNTKRKTGFVGFLLAIESVKLLFKELVEKTDPPMNYLLTYKFSQDHLELFFGAIRSAGGFNNNPTAQQFTAAYKRLLMRSTIAGGKGNCKKLDPTSMLHIIDDICNVNEEDTSIMNAGLIRKYELETKDKDNGSVQDNDSAPPDVINCLSEFKQASISYIAGYVARSVEKKTLCMPCCQALGSATHKPESSFLQLKDRGGLFKPTESVITVCEESEKCFQRMMKVTDGHLPQCKGINDAIAAAVLGEINISKVFKELHSHMFDTPVNDNHIISLIKKISKCYSKVRLYHLGKEATAKLHGKKVRKTLNKLVLFNHQ